MSVNSPASFLTPPKAKYSGANSLEYRSAHAAYTAMFWRIRLRLRRNTPGIFYRSPSCFSIFKFNTREWLEAFDKSYAPRCGRLILHKMFFEDIVIIYDSNIFEYSVSVVREFATGTRDARRQFWRERLRILLPQVCSSFRESHAMNTKVMSHFSQPKMSCVV